jgi:transcription factor C subunit 3
MGSTNDKPTSNRLPVGKKRPGAELERPPGALKKLAMDTADRSSPVVGGTSPGDEAAAPSIPESPILSSVETATGTSKAVKKSIPGRVTKSTKVKLPPGAEAVVQKFTERSEPGVYINPYALRPISRGRPKKAYMAVFKSSRLNEFHWFLPEIDPNPPKPKRRKRLPSHRTEAPEPQAELLSQADTANTEPVDEDMGEDLDVDDTHVRTSPEDNHATVTPVPEESSRDRSQGDSRDDTALHHPPPSSHYLTHATWSAVNAPHRPPYQNASQVTSAPQSAEVDVEMAGVSRTGEHAAEQGDSSSKESVPAEASLSEDQVASNPNATADETRSGAVHLDKAPAVEVAPHSKPNDATPTSGVISLGLSAFTHKRRKKHGAFAKRGVVLGRGNVWRRRTLIVQDILEQCHGVFPFNGEIVAPFFTLWDKGTLKKMSRPDRTTITNTINNMIEDPDCNIRKLVFRIPGIEGKSTVDRFIIARKDIPTNDPRIKALQQNMIKVYPHKYYPEEIRHLVGPEAPHRKIRVPEFDPTISADGQVPSAYHKLDQRILSSAQTRRRRVAGNATKDALSQQPGYRRQRLESLHGAAKSTRGRLGADGAPLHEYRIRSARDGSPASSTSSETSYSGSSTSSDDDRSDVDADFSFEPRVAPEDGFFNLGPTEYKWQSRSTIFSRLLDPPVQFYPNSGTFSTDFGTYPSAVVRGSDRRSSSAPTEVGKEGGWQFIGGWKFIIEQPPFPRSKKRVRFTDAHGEGPRKKRRLENATGDSLSSDGPVSNRGTLKILDPNMNLIRRKPRKQLPQGPAPTLAERLVGHTGNPDDPVYIAPRKKKDHRPRRWTHMKPPEERKEPVPRKPVEILEPGDAFKKMFCALTVASCMCGEEDSVDWTIVAKVYRIDRRFDLEKAKKLWRWIRRNMAEQLQALKSEFQSKFLTAYEKGHIDDIEDPETYDWESLVKWTMKKCEYAQPALPPAREDLHDYDVTESGYRGFSRIDWAQKALAHVIRAQRVLKYAYAAPLHDKPTMPPVDDDLRARSWIRANTATAQDVYNSNVAYNKLQVLGGTMLERTVAELCQLRMIKQRKLKRLLPGRNYDFTATFALKYRRAFDQTVFIDAVEFKKHLDAAFSNPNPEQRFLPVSRTANDGAVMALLSLVCAGKVRLIPKLPPVNNELQAPTPRLSIWGFMEGDYVHRKIDRNRLFWDVHAVPTEDYPFGNPLRPSPKPDNEHDPIEWRPVPEPPLPGKHDPNAPLPIWSSIDGHHVTWPWWYRILNLVLQGIMFQPGVSVHETFSLCPQGTVELFEVELVLRWLVDAGAARETDEGTFIIESGFWAAFGESLVGTENDWFGDHVKRNKMPEMRQPWRKVFNLRSERVDALMRPGGPEGGVGMGVDGDSLFVPEGPAPPSQNGLGESEGEGGGEVLYAFSHLQRPGRKRKRRADRPGDGIGVVIGSASVGLSAQTGVKDVVMRDSDSGGESEEEDDDGPDAEGEMDYEML